MCSSFANIPIDQLSMLLLCMLDIDCKKYTCWLTISCFCFAGVCSAPAMFCQESDAFLRCCQVQGLQGSPCLSLSTRLMSSPIMPLSHYLPKQKLPRSAQKEARQRARGFLCAFRHFLSRFSKYFLPHVSTLFNVVHGRVFAWR